MRELVTEYPVLLAAIDPLLAARDALAGQLGHLDRVDRHGKLTP